MKNMEEKFILAILLKQSAFPKPLQRIILICYVIFNEPRCEIRYIRFIIRRIYRCIIYQLWQSPNSIYFHPMNLASGGASEHPPITTQRALTVPAQAIAIRTASHTEDPHKKSGALLMTCSEYHPVPPPDQSPRKTCSPTQNSAPPTDWLID